MKAYYTHEEDSEKKYIKECEGMIERHSKPHTGVGRHTKASLIRALWRLCVYSFDSVC